MKKAGLLGSADLVGIIKEVAPCATAKTDEELGTTEFEEKYFPHPLFIDEAMDSYKVLGDRSLVKDIPIMRWNVFAMYSDFKSMGARLKAKKVEGNMKGEGIKLGGVIVYSKEKGVVYQYREMTGSEIPTDDIAAAVKLL